MASDLIQCAVESWDFVVRKPWNMSCVHQYTYSISVSPRKVAKVKKFSAQCVSCASRFRWIEAGYFLRCEKAKVLQRSIRHLHDGKRSKRQTLPADVFVFKKQKFKSKKSNCKLWSSILNRTSVRRKSLIDVVSLDLFGVNQLFKVSIVRVVSCSKLNYVLPAFFSKSYFVHAPNLIHFTVIFFLENSLIFNNSF